MDKGLRLVLVRTAFQAERLKSEFAASLARVNHFDGDEMKASF